MQIESGMMQKYTSLRVGGKVQIFTPNNILELQNFIQHNTEKLLFLGLGSNLLVSDNGFNGIVIRTKKLNQISIDANIIDANCGVTLSALSRFAINHNQGGANFLSAIPGSVGGALFMNAGCFGKEIWSFIKSVTTIDNNGNIFQREKSEFEVNYRKIISKNIGEYFIGCKLQFDNNQMAKNILQKRYDSQPIGSANCGSVFKNPPHYFAAKLIQECGLKGFSIGNAQVSTKHANFIINNGGAKSSDILKLITHIQIAVKNKFNINLETEVCIK